MPTECVARCPEGMFQRKEDNVCQLCGDCTDGMYESESCGARSRYEDVKCARCKTKCTAGHFMRGECLGAEGPTEDMVTCEECVSSCDDGLHLQGKCSGGLRLDTVQCVPCTTCNAGEYLKRRCAGDGRDDSVCEPCRTMCPRFTDDIAADSLCDGSASLDTTKCVSGIPAAEDADADAATPPAPRPDAGFPTVHRADFTVSLGTKTGPYDDNADADDGADAAESQKQKDSSLVKELQIMGLGAQLTANAR